MSGLIDYAGLFPPANLELKPSIHKYSNYIQGNDYWMMAKFILPASKLNDLSDEMMAKFSKDNKLRLSLISSDFSKDKTELMKMMGAYSGSILCTTVESKVIEIDQFESMYEKSRIARTVFDHSIQIFYEIDKTPNWKNGVEQLVKQLSELNENYGLNDGFKLRCGGVEQEHFPSPEECAIAINTCRDYDVPMKFTAGLHHPVRHFSESVNTKMFGFFNLFIGGMLAYKYQLNNDLLVEILEDEHPENFIFSEDGMSWKDLKLSNTEIDQLRKSSLISYGSCSFNEPRNDLKDLGLL